MVLLCRKGEEVQVHMKLKSMILLWVAVFGNHVSAEFTPFQGKQETENLNFCVCSLILLREWWKILLFEPISGEPMYNGFRGGKTPLTTILY